MTTKWFLVISMFLLVVHYAISYDNIGHKLTYTSNPDTYENHRIYFEKPLEQNWLEGSLILNGNGQYQFGNRGVTNYFDAFAKLIKIAINGTQVALFTTKFVQSDYYKESKKAETITPYMLLADTDPGLSIWEKLMGLNNGLDNPSQNIVQFKSDGEVTYQAMGDSLNRYEIDPLTLDTNEKQKVKIPEGLDVLDEKMVTGSPFFTRMFKSTSYLTFLAHLNPFGIGPKSSVNLIKQTSNDHSELIASIPLKTARALYSISASENFAVVMLPACYVSLWKIMTMAPIMDTIEWQPDMGNEMHVVNIHTGEVVAFTGLHAEIPIAVNAWEDHDDKIFIDYISCQDVNALKSLEINTMKKIAKGQIIPNPCQMVRTQLDLSTKQTKRKILETNSRTINLLYPTLNKDYRFRKHCFVYGIETVSKKNTGTMMCLVKRDLCGHSKDKTVQLPNHYLSEPHFVGSPGEVKEDEGVILMVVLDGLKERSYLALYDAVSMEEVNRAWLPTFVPYLHHGGFFAGQK